MDTNKHESERAYWEAIRQCKSAGAGDNLSWKLLFTNLRVYSCKFVVIL